MATWTRNKRKKAFYEKYSDLTQRYNISSREIFFARCNNISINELIKAKRQNISLHELIEKHKRSRHSGKIQDVVTYRHPLSKRYRLKNERFPPNPPEHPKPPPPPPKPKPPT